MRQSRVLDSPTNQTASSPTAIEVVRRFAHLLHGRASELLTRARIELHHAVGTSEPDGIGGDHNGRRAPETVREQLVPARRRIDTYKFAPSSLEGPDGAVANREHDRLERDGEQRIPLVQGRSVGAALRAPPPPRAR